MNYEYIERLTFFLCIFVSCSMTLISVLYVPFVTSLFTAVIVVFMCLTISSMFFLIRELCLGCLLRTLLHELRMEQERENVLYMMSLNVKEEECSICMEELNECVMLDCGHKFHTNCMNKWLEEQSPEASCPLCRDDLLKYRVTV